MVQTVLSAVNYLIAKTALTQAPSTAVAMLRLTGTAVCFVLVLLAVGRRPWPPRRFWKTVTVLALLGVPVNQGCFLEGLSRTSPAHAVLLYTLTPLVVFFIALALRTEELERTKVVGLGLAILGAALVILERSGDGATHGALSGDLILLVGVISWAGYTAFGKPLVADVGAVAATGWTLIVGTFLYLPIGLPAMRQIHLQAMPGSFWWAIVYLVLCTSIISYLCWYYALGRLEPSRVAVFTNLQPVMTAVASWLFLGEQLTPRLLSGGALVMAGVVIATHVGVRERLRSAMTFPAPRPQVGPQE
jgi:drug/metabolite transporter (DMT)-like permease